MSITPNDGSITELRVTYSTHLPKDLQFAQVVVFASEAFGLSQGQIRDTLAYLMARNERAESQPTIKYS